MNMTASNWGCFLLLLLLLLITHHFLSLWVKAFAEWIHVCFHMHECPSSVLQPLFWCSWIWNRRLLNSLIFQRLFLLEQWVFCADSWPVELWSYRQCVLTITTLSSQTECPGGSYQRGRSDKSWPLQGKAWNATDIDFLLNKLHSVFA